MMGKTATINVRVDEDDKKSAEFVLNQLGMPMSTLVTLLLKQVSLTMMVQEYHNAEGEHVRPVNEFFNEFRMKIDD